MHNPDFQVKKFTKHGAFAIQLTEANWKDIELLKTKTNEDDQSFIDSDEPFVYKAPWDNAVGHSHMVLRAGDECV